MPTTLTFSSEALQSLAPLLVILLIWELSWKGVTLWKSAQRKQKVWFVALLIVNSAGILPIVYLLLNPKAKR
jgi:hypothetical protein